MMRLPKNKDEVVSILASRYLHLVLSSSIGIFFVLYNGFKRQAASLLLKGGMKEL